MSSHIRDHITAALDEISAVEKRLRQLHISLTTLLLQHDSKMGGTPCVEYPHHIQHTPPLHIASNSRLPVGADPRLYNLSNRCLQSRKRRQRKRAHKPRVRPAVHADPGDASQQFVNSHSFCRPCCFSKPYNCTVSHPAALDVPKMHHQAVRDRTSFVTRPPDSARPSDPSRVPVTARYLNAVAQQNVQKK